MIFPFAQTIYGLLAAVTWGAGDFFGGIATKKTTAYTVVTIAHSFSLICLILLALLLHENVPPLIDWVWGGIAGLGGGFGLMLLYNALAKGKMAIAAPVSALVAASLPVVFSVFFLGLPGILILLGFLLALISIWLLSSDGKFLFSFSELQLPLAAGIAFGIFFLCLHQASSVSIIYPIIAVRIISIISVSIYTISIRQRIIPSKDSYLPILLSGLLDTIGNGAFALASQYGRVDVAAVLGSLYPGATVLLAWLFLRETINRRQGIGIVLALLSIILITS